MTAAVLAALSFASLGPAGVTAWLNDLSIARADPHTAPMTYSYLFGQPAAAGVEIALAFAALSLAWLRRDRLDLVFALGLVGTTASGRNDHTSSPHQPGVQNPFALAFDVGQPCARIPFEIAIPNAISLSFRFPLYLPISMSSVR